MTKRGRSSMSLITAQLPVRLTPLVGRESELNLGDLVGFYTDSAGNTEGMLALP